MAPVSIQQIAIIGFGEAGGILGCDLAKQQIAVSTFDILFHSLESREAMLSKARESGVEARDNLSDCMRNAELIISAVTASFALRVAEESSPLLCDHQIFLDINSVSPGTKRAIAAHIENGKGCFIEAAVMAPVPGNRLKVPMLLGGKYAAEFAARLQAIGMNATEVSDRIGVASAIKMCRSVMIKGMEALAVECMFAARLYAAEEAVLASLAATYPQMGWQDRLPDYLISRVAEHGKRRAAEMREVAQALRDVGIDPLMAEATAERQDGLISEMASRRIDYKSETPFSWTALCDALSSDVKSGKAK
jgi:3-hydroxyisobutyrate dehydrogenase-like beta-hydroxyacid dehydrogenase